MQRKKIKCYVPKKKLQNIAREFQYGDYTIFKPTRKSKVMNLSEFDILSLYNKEIKNLAHYYCAVENPHSLLKLRSLAQSSFLRTISAKRKTTPKKGC
ncbi:group II intron reverse transcriptase/maturase [Virgibacillus halophilus]|uniref:Group II intron reverse transcriptase/maturase n=1 Tax=Tigheibacillus halophilus TaxID=361280 RepID=A0ABU5CCD9_9BACI|nr:group II intron reverse transcriptase/maturase [Virgibacillus halophilus]